VDVGELDELEVWFVTGSISIYGEEALQRVAADAREIAGRFDGSREIPVRVTRPCVVASPEEIRGVVLEANAVAKCVGIIAWMHTFSPARMWIAGLSALQKPLLHLHTQFNRDLPWSDIDMDFMNLNQSAHGTGVCLPGDTDAAGAQDGGGPLGGRFGPKPGRHVGAGGVWPAGGS